LKFDTPARVNAIQASCGSGAASAFCFTGTADTQLVDDSGNVLGTNPDYGLHSGLGPTKEGVPFIDVDGGFTIGNNFNGQLPQTGNTYQFSDNFSKIIGNHSLKFGGDARYQMFNQLLYFDVNGDMSFLFRRLRRLSPRLGQQFLSGISTARACAQHFDLPLCAGQLENQAESDPELRLALGNEYAADGYRQESSDLPSRAGIDDLSLHASFDEPTFRPWKR
jgi:hypothetical protein